MIRQYFNITLSVLIACTLSISGFGQTSNFTWSGLDIRIPLDSKSHIDIKPIIRHNLDGDGYQNLSLDLFYKRKFANGYFSQVLSRTWYLQDARYRQFFWLDIGKGWKVNKLSITQKFRLHYAHDVNDNFDADFIRSFTQVIIPLAENLKFSLTLEPWLSLNDDIEIDRYRIEPGFTYIIARQLTLAAVYRWQSDFRLDPNFDQNHIVTTLVYTLKPREVKSQ